jgi:hypothetical protein
LSALVVIPNITDQLILRKVFLSLSIILSKVKLLRLKKTFRFYAKTTTKLMPSATAANTENFYARIALMKTTLTTSILVTN